MRMLLFFTSILVVALSILGFQKEYAPAITLQASGQEAAQLLANLDGQNPPSSARILRDIVTLCADAVRLADVHALKEDLKEKLLQSCANLAKQTLEKSPSFSRAHILSLISQPRNKVTPEAYHLARMAAPHEPWPLSNRLLLAENLVSEGLLTPFYGEIRADVDNAMRTNWGRSFLARLWARQPALRDLILTIAETHPDADQRHFLDQTRRALTNG